MTAETSSNVIGDKELAEAVDRLLEHHPGIREALELFKVSQESYEESIKAMQTRPVYSSASANETALQQNR